MQLGSALFTGAQEQECRALAEAVAFHRSYRGESAAPRARVALGPLAMAMASLAYDHGFPVALPQPYLPTYLLNRQRIEEIPG